MTRADVPLPQKRGFGDTSRTDGWWISPLLTFLGLSAFIVYSTWGALQNEHYFLLSGGAQYLSPFYSPVFWDAAGQNSGHAIFEGLPSWWPGVIPFFPAFMILWAPGGFRFTCYYYRGAYYKSFWADPPQCSVGEPRNNFRGENSFPLIFQNVHRYFMYVAVVFIFILGYDAWKGFWFIGEDGAEHFGVHVGSLVLTLNVILLGGYTFGCHSLRHIIAGKFNIFSKRPVRKTAYDCVSCLNRGHMLFAWCSLFWVGFTDFYIRMCSMGIFTDLRFF